jgi:hypothetical protein
MLNYSDYFKQKERTDGVTFWHLTDDAPEILSDFVHDVHKEVGGSSMWAHDWVHEQIAYAFDECAENDIDDITIEPDPYYSDLYEWLKDGYARSYCEEAIREGICDGKDMDKTVMAGNWLAKDRIYRLVGEFLEKNPLTDSNVE